MSRKPKFVQVIGDGKDHWAELRDASFYLKGNKEESKTQPKFVEIRAKTKNQNDYINSMSVNIITFCLGVAGTGKTYVACGYACKMLHENKIEQIVITRPIVECGKSLGHLPGDIKEKTDPYMQHIFKAIGKFFDADTVKKLFDDKKIIVEPLEYMRGETYDNAFLILDEAQNITQTQIKMFLTRIGENCKVVLCGDTSQSDLTVRDHSTSALDWAVERLTPHADIGVVTMSYEDIQRNKIVKHILMKLF